MSNKLVVKRTFSNRIFALFIAVCLMLGLAHTAVRGLIVKADNIDDIPLTVDTYDGLNKETVTIRNTEGISAFSVPQDWGGYVKMLTLDKAYDVSAVGNSGDGAISFWMFFASSAGVERYKQLGGWNLDISAGDSYSDSIKYSFNIAGIFDNCIVGWNNIILPLSTADEKNSMNWTKVKFLRLNGDSIGGTPAGAKVSFADFRFIESEYTSRTVIEEFPQEEIEDISLTVDTYDGLSKETVTIRNTEGISAFSVPQDWGGYVKMLTLDKAYDVSAVGNSGDGAISFWMFFASSAGVERYKQLGGWNLDISAGDSYSDSIKYSFNIAGIFDNCIVGWNNIILPLSTADEKNSMNWTKVKFLRLNGDSIGGTPAGAKVSFADFRFIESEYTSRTVIEEFPQEEIEDISLTVDTYDGLSKETVTIRNTEGISAFSVPQDWGGYVRILTLDKAYDVSAIGNAGDGAISFWMHFSSSAAVERYKQLGGWNLDISAGDSYSDSIKYSFNIAGIFDNCTVGWNNIILPLSTAEEKNSMNWTNVKFLRLNGDNIGGTPAGAKVSFADFRFIKSEYTSRTVVEEFPQEIIEDVFVNVSGYGGLIQSETRINYVGAVTAYSVNRDNGGYTELLTLDKAYDLRLIGAASDGAVSFWIKFADSEALNRYKQLSGWNLDISAGDSYSDSIKYSFNIAELFNDCTVGWNNIILPLSTAEEKNNMDWTKVKFIRLNGNNLGGTAVGSEVSFASFSFITTEFSTRTAIAERELSDTDSGILSVAGYSDLALGTASIETVGVINTYSVNRDWGGYIKTLTLDRAYDVSLIEASQSAAFVFWMNFADKAVLDRYKALDNTDNAGRNWNIDIGSGVSFADSAKYSFGIKNLFAECETGWNCIILPLEIADEKTGIDWTDIKFIRLNGDILGGTGGNNAVSFGGFRIMTSNENTATVITENSLIDDSGREPIDELIIVDCDYTGPNLFLGNNVDRGDFRQGTGCVWTSGSGYELRASGLNIGKTDLTKRTFVLAMWIWIEDPALFNSSNVESQIEISSSNAFDAKELNWDFKAIASGLEQGWNWVVLKGEDASVSGGEPDFDNLSRFRLYVNKISNSMIKIDRITIGYAGNTALFSEPDWQNERADSDGPFKGQNSLMPHNGTYLEFDFDTAEEITYTESEKQRGCRSRSDNMILLLAFAGLVFFRRPKASV